MEKPNRSAGVTDAPMKPSEILDEAAEVIERNGLAAGDWYVPEGNKAPSECRVCTGAALAIGAGQSPRFLGFYDPTGPLAGAVGALLDRLNLSPLEGQWRPEVAAIAAWNDSGCTDAEVVAELRAAAASEREAGR